MHKNMMPYPYPSFSLGWGSFIREVGRYPRTPTTTPSKKLVQILHVYVFLSDHLLCLQIHFAVITIEHIHILQETCKDSEHNRFLDCTKPKSSLLAYTNAMLTGLSCS